jgi:8-oxo-dGTP pyrophosphatase MutT (NUDIX family)
MTPTELTGRDTRSPCTRVAAGFYLSSMATKTRQERSAGVVIFHRDEEDDSSPRQYLLLDYGKHWDFPKGHVEADEEVTDTALRELEEETGITDAQLIAGFSHEIEYFFRDRRKRLVHKTVCFLLAETKTSDIRLSDEHVGFEFLPYEAALKRLTYANAKSILREAESFNVKQEG